MPITLDGTAGITNDATDLNYTGTLTGGTGVINIGLGQLYKDASGNVGIGTSSPAVRLHVDGTGTQYIRVSSSTHSNFAQTFASDGSTGVEYKSVYRLVDTDAGERMRIDSGGKLLLGVTSGAGLSNGDFAMANGNHIRFRNAANSAYISAFEFTSANGLNIGAGGSLSTITFGISGIGEVSRFDTSGNLLVGTTSASARFFSVTSSDQTVIRGSNTSGAFSNNLVLAEADRNTTNGTFNAFGYFNNGAGAYRFRVLDSGNVQNTNNSYGAISDAKLKENVVDATPKLEKLNQVRIVNYNMIGEEQKQLGVIAQELEQIFPGMVEESPDRDKEGNDLGTTTKSVKYSVFVPMLIKAMQEQQDLITSQTAALQEAVAEINSLKARVEALEGAQIV
jgi:hypothetical protein